MPSITHLPVELLDMIVSALIGSSGSTATTNAYLADVRRCSLVCRTLAAVSRKYIFRDISVRGDDNPRILAFAEIVKSRESVKFDVKVLRYDYDPTGDHEACAQTGCACEPPLTLVFDLLSGQGVQVFHFEASDFEKLDDLFVDAVTAFISSNPLVELGLHGVYNMPASYWRPTGWLKPTLKSLILEAADTDGIYSATSPVDPPPGAQLERFEMHDCEPEYIASHLIPSWYDHPSRESESDEIIETALHDHKYKLPPIDFTRLKYLYISDKDLGDDMSKEVATVPLIGYILMTTQCLEFLSLKESNHYGVTYYTSRVLSANLNASSLRSLKCIEIVLDLARPEDDPYFSFTDELASLARRSEMKLDGTPLGLQRLTIKILEDEPIRAELNLDIAQWSKLDTVLMDNITASGTCNPRAAFRNLKEVEIIVDRGHWGSELDDIRPSLNWIGQHAFPRLRASRGVRFTFSPEAAAWTSNYESDGDDYDSESS